jgi:cation diffusion facilitator family transporter
VASLTRFAWLSIAAAVATIVLKSTAYLLTGSVGLLSDAIESTVNLAAAIIALFALRLAARPADQSHAWGHGKAEYFSAGAEGVMIFVAAGAVIYTAIDRLVHPQALEQVGVGLAVSGIAAVLNFAVARVLLRAGQTHRSITLVADGKHLMTDVWTSVGVIVGVGLVALVHWPPLDPIVAILVGVNILVAGWALIRNSSAGLMDAALPAGDLAALEAVLARYRRAGEVDFDAVRTRAAGQQRFVSLRILVPGLWTVRDGHHLAERVEADVKEALPGASFLAQVEPVDSEPSPADVGAVALSGR